MVSIDEARFEQLIVAETKLKIIYNLLKNNQYCMKAEICNTMDWTALLEENVASVEETEDDVNMAQGA